MIIINNQTIHHSAAVHMIDSAAHSDAILTAMDQTQDVFNYPNAALFGFAIRLHSNIVDSAMQLSKTNVKFATFYGSRCNDEYWDLTSEGGFRLKSNARASEAILDIYKNSDQYAFECATAMVIILLRAVLELLGTERFDRLYRNIYLWDWHHQQNLPLTIEAVTDNGIPGDIRYFKNPEVDPRKGWWQGENAILLPNNRYYGHGVGIQTAEGVISTLNKNRRPGATESAYLMHRATRVDVTQLYLLMNRDITGWTAQTAQPLRRRPKIVRSFIRPGY